MFPGHVDGGFHIVRQNDELRQPIVVMATECDNV